MATERLIRLGHTRIAHLTTPLRYTYSVHALHGYRDALDAHGIGHDPALEIECYLSRKTGADAVTELITRGVGPTAIFCGNDVIALSAMEAMRQCGIRPGPDMALIGCDDVPVAAHVGLGLTTFRQDLDALEPGRVFQASNVWALTQTVTGVLLRSGREAESWVAALPSVLNAVDTNYRELVLRRMFATAPDTALRTDLGRRFGFSMLVPEVYDRIARDLGGGDSLVILRNDNPDPSELIRSILVAWRPGVDSLTRELALEWRAEIDAVHYNVPQRIDDTNSSVVSFMWEGRPALEVTGVWQDESGGFPAAGPFIVWLVDCPARTYFVDAWLYSPNRAKYEYMLQLQEILGSFRCVE